MKHLFLLIFFSFSSSAFEVIAPHAPEGGSGLFSSAAFKEIKEMFAPSKSYNDNSDVIIVPVQKNSGGLRGATFIQPVVSNYSTPPPWDLQRVLNKLLNVKFKLNEPFVPTPSGTTTNQTVQPLEAALIASDSKLQVKVKGITHHMNWEKCATPETYLEATDTISIKTFSFLIFGLREFKTAKVLQKEITHLKFKIPRHSWIKNLDSKKLTIYALDLNGDDKFELLMGRGLTDDSNSGTLLKDQDFFFIMKAKDGAWHPENWVWQHWGDSIC